MRDAVRGSAARIVAARVRSEIAAQHRTQAAKGEGSLGKFTQRSHTHSLGATQGRGAEGIAGNSARPRCTDKEENCASRSQTAAARSDWSGTNSKGQPIRTHGAHAATCTTSPHGGHATHSTIAWNTQAGSRWHDKHRASTSHTRERSGGEQPERHRLAHAPQGCTVRNMDKAAQHGRARPGSTPPHGSSKRTMPNEQQGQRPATPAATVCATRLHPTCACTTCCKSLNEHTRERHPRAGHGGGARGTPWPTPLRRHRKARCAAVGGGATRRFAPKPVQVGSQHASMGSAGGCMREQASTSTTQQRKRQQCVGRAGPKDDGDWLQEQRKFCS